MRKILRILPVFFFLLACSGKNKVPRGILPPQKMQAIMWDMLKADGFVSEYLSKDSSLDKKQESIKLYDEIFLIHTTNKEEFKKSLSYYQDHPAIYKVLLDSLSANHSGETQKDDEPTLTDSILSKKIRAIGVK